MDRNPFLKVKLKSLAAESLIIRKEMAEYMKTTYTYNKLHLHRVHEVREEARATLIAYGFLRGLPFHTIEASSYTQPNWDKVRYMIRTYGGHGGADVEQLLADFKSWVQYEVNNRGMYIAVIPQLATAE